jgi:hypothetical protein
MANKYFNITDEQAIESVLRDTEENPNKFNFDANGEFSLIPITGDVIGIINSTTLVIQSAGGGAEYSFLANKNDIENYNDLITEAGHTTNFVGVQVLIYLKKDGKYLPKGSGTQTAKTCINAITYLRKIDGNLEITTDTRPFIVI